MAPVFSIAGSCLNPGRLETGRARYRGIARVPKVSSGLVRRDFLGTDRVIQIVLFDTKLRRRAGAAR